MYTWGKTRCAYKMLGRKLKDGRPSRKRVDNFEINLKGTVYEVANWIQLAQYKVQCWHPVNTVMNRCVPWRAGISRPVNKYQLLKEDRGP